MIQKTFKTSPRIRRGLPSADYQRKVDVINNTVVDRPLRKGPNFQKPKRRKK